MCFVRGENSIRTKHVVDDSSHIKKFAFADCFEDSCTLEESDDFISPGIIIRHSRESEIVGRATDGTILFRYEALHKLKDYVLDDSYLFALDSIGNMYMYKQGTYKPKQYELSRRPVGWALIHSTKTFVYWTTLSFYVYNIDSVSQRTLSGHCSNITAVATSLSTVCSGDSTGILCIWYVSSWQCHHTVNTGARIHSICLRKSTVCVLTTSLLKCYNMESGSLLYSTSVSGNRLISLPIGILVSNYNYIALFKNGVPRLCFKNKHVDLCSSREDNRFFSLNRKKAAELNLNCPEWPSECIDWISQPTMPFTKVWPKRYLDVLAISADLWVPRLKQWSLPKSWFRHERLRDSIWNAVIENGLDVDYSWLFLTPHVMKQWYNKNVNEILLQIKNGEYMVSVVGLLRRIYKHVTIENPLILKWCWKHHGRKSLNAIIQYLLSHDAACTMLSHIVQEPMTPDAALCITLKAVVHGLKKGYVAIFIQMLASFHTSYVSVPTHHMRDIFKAIISHLYSKLKTSTLDLPLSETGYWSSLSRLNPSITGAYVKSAGICGHITEIKFHPESSAYWKPLDSKQEKFVTDNAMIWEYYYDDGPKTLLECALTILNNDAWSSKSVLKPWSWFQTEMGAFESEGLSVRVFDSPMRITSASVLLSTNRIHTSSNLIIDEAEKVEIVAVAPLWSYYDCDLYHIVPMRLKICSEVLKCTRCPVSIMYARELISCIQYKTFQREYVWNTERSITTFTSGLNCFFLGTDTGKIYQYTTVADFVPFRTLLKHVHAIKSLAVVENRLLSMCDKEVHVWCLQTGVCLFTTHSYMDYEAVIFASMGKAWILERDEEHLFIQLWDIQQELALHRHHILIENEEVLLTTNSEFVITTKRAIKLSDMETIEIKGLLGHITCATVTPFGLCIGTSVGTLYMLDKDFSEIQSFQTLQKDIITCITDMGDQPYVLTGSESGDVAIWDILEGVSILRTNCSRCRIHHIYFDNMFCLIIYYKTIELSSIVHERCILAVNTINCILQWSERWKTRLLKYTSAVIQPTVETCILSDIGILEAIEVIMECTTEYADRLYWCNTGFIDVLLKVPTSVTGVIIKRLASFKGPKLDCVICCNPDKVDTICFIKTCQHRFHSECIEELIRKVPEYNREMQYEYALTVTLKCPTCRKLFNPTDVQQDLFLSRALLSPR